MNRQVILGAIVVGMAFTLPRPWMTALQVTMGLLLLCLGLWRGPANKEK